MAQQEFLLNGQDGLDGLLAALDGGFEVTQLDLRRGWTPACVSRCSIPSRLPICLVPSGRRLQLPLDCGGSMRGALHAFFCAPNTCTKSPTDAAGLCTNAL